MFKFGRNYILSVQTQDNQTLVIQPPFTMEFDITRNTLSSANVCSIKVFNLSKNNRNAIRFNIMDTGIFRAIQLQAGYGDTNLPIIFSGNITQAWSVREGVNFITAIECFDGGYALSNSFTAESFPANTPAAIMLRNIAEDLPQVSVGAIGSYPGELSRGNALVGNSADLLRELSGGGFFIDNGQAHVLGNNEYIDDGPTIVIDSDTGLLNTPVREFTKLTFDIIFEPAIKPARLIQLQSKTEPSFNGFRKVVGVKHRGMISPAVCGDAITTVETWYEKTFVPVLVS